MSVDIIDLIVDIMTRENIVFNAVDMHTMFYENDYLLETTLYHATAIGGVLGSAYNALFWSVGHSARDKYTIDGSLSLHLVAIQRYYELIGDLDYFKQRI